MNQWMLHLSRIGRRPRRRPALAALAVAVLTAAGTLSLGPSASAAISIDPNAHYVIVNANSGKAIDLWEWSTVDGGEFRQFTRTNATNQQFQLISSGDGYYRLKNRHSGRVVDVWGWSVADGAEIRQATDNNFANQQFRLTGADNNAVRFINRHSGKALEVWERSTADGARLSQYTDVSGTNQTWALVPAGSAPTNPGTCGSGTGDAEVTQSANTWTARRGGSTVYTGSDLVAASQAAIDSLTSGRTSIQRVVVRGSGTISAGSRISLRSFTSFEVCGTIHVSGSGSGDLAPVYARGVTNVAVPHLTVTGTPNYGIFMRSVSNLHLGQIDLRLNSGLGIRIDNHGDTTVKARNVRIDSVHVSGTSAHGVETYGVDGLTIGTVTARNTGYSGLLLNDTINATVGTVDADGAGTGTGYAAFRMANRNGRVGSAYPTNIRVGKVIARGGGRGVFCVSESGGAVIDQVDITNTGNNAILVENCHNVTIAGTSGSVSGGGEIRISARTEFANTSGITFQNLTVTNNVIRESPCAVNTVVRNLQLNNSSLAVC